MKKSEFKKRLKDIQYEQDEASWKSALSRARALTVGTCFNGVTEISMRGADGTVLWTPLQPVEVVELIHQLAANIGCHIMIKPRNDFSSWRGWKTTDGKPLLSHDMDQYMRVGADEEKKEQPKLQIPVAENLKEKENASLATEEVINKRASKRAAKIT